MTEPIIHAEGLTRLFTTRRKPAALTGLKRFFAKAEKHSLTAVSDLTFSIEAGSKVAFIGPNGAGKSTTLKMLCGLLAPSSGTATVCGFTPWKQNQELARHLGLVFGQHSQLWPDLPLIDSFNLLAKIYDLDTASYQNQKARLTELFNLGNLLNQRVKTFSLGQRMRADIAAALLHKPDVLFLDEPTIGLDVTAKASLREHLNRLAREFETTLLLTSHDTDDIEQICQRVILIDLGKKLLDTSLDALKAQFAGTKTITLVTEEETPIYTRKGVTMFNQDAHKVSLAIALDEAPLESVIAECLSRFKIRDLGVESMPLEEIIKKLYAAPPTTDAA